MTTTSIRVVLIASIGTLVLGLCLEWYLRGGGGRNMGD